MSQECQTASYLFIFMQSRLLPFLLSIRQRYILKVLIKLFQFFLHRFPPFLAFVVSRRRCTRSFHQHLDVRSSITEDRNGRCGFAEPTSCLYDRHVLAVSLRCTQACHSRAPQCRICCRSSLVVDVFCAPVDCVHFAWVCILLFPFLDPKVASLPSLYGRFYRYSEV